MSARYCWITCPTCDGTGLDPLPPHEHHEPPCPQCEGEGEIEIDTEEFDIEDFTKGPPCSTDSPSSTP